MLSIRKCRVLLGNPNITDEEVKIIRDFLYKICDWQIDEILSKKQEENK